MESQRRFIWSFPWAIYITIFFIYLAYSYRFVIESAIPAAGVFGSFLLSIIVAILIVRLIGGSAVTLYRATRGTVRDWLLLSVTVVPALLLTILALLPTSVWVMLGPDVVRGDLANAMDNLTTLQRGAEGWLRVSDYEEMRARVEKLRKLLIDEINSDGQSNYCGVGPAAKNTINEITKDLPTLYVFPGTDIDHDCRKVEAIKAIATRYASAIDDQLEHHPLAVRYNIPGRRKLVAPTSPFIRDISKELTDLREQEAITAGLSFYLTDQAAYRSAVRQLEHASTVYASNYSGVASFTPNGIPGDIPRTLDISHSQSIGTSTQIFETYRFLPISVKKIVVIAISLLADIIAVLLSWRRVEERGGLGLQGTIRGMPLLNS